MIFVAGTMKIALSQLEAFQADFAAMRPRVLEEDGCVHYSLLLQDAATGLINVHEQWDSVDALKVHFTMPWIIDFATKFGPHMSDNAVQVYHVSGTEPLPGM